MNFFKILLFTTLSSISLLINAQDLGRVYIRNGNTSYPKFITTINGVRLHNDYVSSICFNYLEETNYRIKIIQSGSSNVLSFMVASAPNYICKYILNKDNYGNYGLILESKSLITDRDEIVNYIPNPTTATIITTPTVSLPPEIVIPTPTITPTPTIEIVPIPLNEVEFVGILSSIKKESLDNGKVSIAKTFLNKKNLTTTQVVSVLKEFSFEKNKLEIAKFLYDQTIDKQNYFKVLDVFSITSSKKELTAFIKTKS